MFQTFYSQVEERFFAELSVLSATVAVLLANLFQTFEVFYLYFDVVLALIIDG